MDANICIERFSEGRLAFLDYLALSRDVSTHTLRAYERDTDEFLAWFAEIFQQERQSQSQMSASKLASLFRELPSRFVSHLNARQLARTSIARKVSSIKTFFRFLAKERYFEPGLLPTSFRRPKLQKPLPDFLSPTEVDQLLSVLKSQDDSALKWRNIAIIELLFSSGIRVSELTALNMEDINRKDCELRIRGKGGRERIGFMGAQALAALEQYLHYWLELAAPRKKEASQENENSTAPEAKSPVFLNYNGSRITSRSVARMLENVSEEAGLNKGAHPHIFRHSFATHLLNHGVDLRVVQELLGHVSIRSTQIYTHITTERLKRAYLNAHPRALAQKST